LSVTFLEKMPILRAFSQPQPPTELVSSCNQLALFDL
jgi:hypothetical protein